MTDKILFEVYNADGILVEVMSEAPDHWTRIGFEQVGYYVKPVLQGKRYIKVGDNYVRTGEQ